MKRSFVTVAVLIAACSARGTINTPPTDFDVVPFEDAPVVPDVPVVDRSMAVDKPIVIVEDTPVVDTPSPPPDEGLGGCSRDTDCEGSTWCEAATRMCRPIVCTPGRTQCLSAMRARVCDARGSMATETNCPGGCADGVCAGAMIGCTAPLTQCAAMCVDTAIDAANCGRCGNACTAGQSCVGSTCVAMPACTAPQMLCGGSCVDVRTNIMHCGRCNNACGAGRACSAGVCTSTTMCTLPEVNCGGVCVNTQTSATNCGLCGRACVAGQTCVAGSCTTAMACTSPRVMRGASCVDPSTDPGNCGACGRACLAGQACTSGTCTALGAGPSLRIMSLGTTGCRVVDHESTTGDDRGGIAVGSTSMFYSGDVATARFDLETLAHMRAGTVTLGYPCSNLASGLVYVLASSATTQFAGSGAVTHLIEVDGATGALTSRATALSAPIMASGEVGVFSGWQRIVLTTAGQVWNIELPSGRVSSLGAMVVPAHAPCEFSGFWGVAEYFDGRVHLAYVESATRIARVRVPDGMISTLGTFSNLSDMCSFSISPQRSRWYFHHEGGSQLGGTSETAGWCPSVIAAGGPVACSAPLTMCGMGCVDLQSDTAHCGACARACTAGQVCRAGVCSTVTTGMSYTRIDPPASVTFIDACTAPGALRILPGSDDSSSTTPLPFVFPFWGAPIAAGRPVGVSTNGFISLDGIGSSVTGGELPSTSAPNGVIAAYWRDLVTSSPSGICIVTVGAAPSRRFVVEWPAARHYGSSSVTITTEVVLNESDGAIDLLTQSASVGVSTATVGVENLAGTRAVSGCVATTALCTPVTGGRVRFAPAP